MTQPDRPAGQDLATRALGDTPGSLERIDHLDGWRGLAIVLVLASHFLGLDGLEAGRLGVDVFFVLSGMLMSRILFVNRTPLSLFYKRRLSRILPVFLLFVGVVFGLGALRGQSFGSGDVLATLAFLRTYVPAEPTIWNLEVPIGHLWSLNVEEHGYVILSLIAAASSATRRNAAACLGLGLATLGAHVIYIKVITAPPADFPLRTECAATGLMLSAGYFLLKDRCSRHVRGWMPPLALALAAACYLREGVPWWSSAFVAPFCLAFCVNHLGESARWCLQLFRWVPLRLMGIWSYSIYLWQQPFYRLGEVWPPVLALLAAMLVGLASYYWFEQPTRRWLNARLGSYPDRPARS